MKKEETLTIIETALKSMGCENIAFIKQEEKSITVAFDCKEITSFVTQVPGWKDSGIQLDRTGSHQYKIDFYSLS